MNKTKPLSVLKKRSQRLTHLIEALRQAPEVEEQEIPTYTKGLLQCLSTEWASRFTTWSKDAAYHLFGYELNNQNNYDVVSVALKRLRELLITDKDVVIDVRVAGEHEPIGWAVVSDIPEATLFTTDANQAEVWRTQNGLNVVQVFTRPLGLCKADIDFLIEKSVVAVEHFENADLQALAADTRYQLNAIQVRYQSDGTRQSCAEELALKRMKWLQDYHRLSLTKVGYVSYGKDLIERYSDGWILDKDLDYNRTFDKFEEAIDVASMLTDRIKQRIKDMATVENGLET